MKLFSRLDDKVVVTRGYMVSAWSFFAVVAGLNLSNGPGVLKWVGFGVSGIALLVGLLTFRHLLKAPKFVSVEKKEAAE